MATACALILIFWAACALGVIGSYAGEIERADSEAQVIICIIMAIGAPFLLINNVFLNILDKFMPEGWDDNDSE